MGFSPGNSGWRSYYSNNYNDNIPFFIGLVRRPKVDVSLARDGSRIGFQVIVERNRISRPSANCKGTQYNFERQDHHGEIGFLQENTPYFVYPFVINQDPSKGAYIVQRDSRLREIDQFDTTPIQASILISGEDFKMEKNYLVRTNLEQLRANSSPNDLIRTENITFSLEEIKEPSLRRRFLSSFSVSRAPIPK